MNVDINPENGDTEKAPKTLLLNLTLINLTISEEFIATFEQPLHTPV
jgi:hypothetical protein